VEIQLRNKFLYLFFIFLVSQASVIAEIIHTTHGTAIEGTIVSTTQEGVTVQIPYGTITLAHSEISQIGQKKSSLVRKNLLRKFLANEAQLIDPTVPPRTTLMPRSLAQAKLNSKEPLLLQSFSDPRLNALGQPWGVWEHDPADKNQGCSANIVLDKRNQKNEQVLKIDYDVDSPNTASNGFFTLIGEKDLSAYKYIEFWIRRDSFGYDRIVEFQFLIGSTIFPYEVRGVSRVWTKVKIPLRKFKGLKNWAKIDQFTIVFNKEKIRHKEGTILIDELTFIA